MNAWDFLIFQKANAFSMMSMHMEPFKQHCHRNHVKGYFVSNKKAGSFLFIEDFKNFWTELSPKLAKFVWEVFDIDFV